MIGLQTRIPHEHGICNQCTNKGIKCFKKRETSKLCAACTDDKQQCKFGGERLEAPHPQGRNKADTEIGDKIEAKRDSKGDSKVQEALKSTRMMTRRNTHALTED